jgi:hypothetical protein
MTKTCVVRETNERIMTHLKNQVTAA